MNQSFSKICNTALLRTGLIDSKNINNAYDRLFLTLIECKGYSEVDLNTLTTDFNSFYRTRINTIFAKNFAHRLERKGYVKKTGKDSFSINIKTIKELNLLTQYNKLVSNNELLINDFWSFLNDFPGCSYSKAQATDLLLKSIENGVTNLGQTEYNQTNDNDSYLLHLYLNKIKKDNTILFEFYKNIMYGRVLSSFIDGNERYLTANSGFFKDTTFYLDSGFVFNLLGLNSNSNGVEYEDMIRVLQNLGAHVKVFRHILSNEIEYIIHSSIGYVENPLYKPSKSPNVTNYFVENGYSKVEVEEYYHSLERRLNGYGITIEDYDIDYNEKDTAFEQDFYNMIIKDYEKTGKLDEDRKQTYWNDAKSLFLIHKLRKGKTYTKLSDTMHVLLTTNSGIGRVANEFNKKVFKGNNTPYALTDLSLNVILFISYGNYSENTNERFTIPAAFHGFDPSKEWLCELDKQLDKAKETGAMTEKEIVNWKTSKFLLNELVKTTKGNPELFDEKTIENTLRRYKEEADKMVDDIDAEARQKIKIALSEKEKIRIKLNKERQQNIENTARLKDQILKTLENNIDSLKNQKNQLLIELNGLKKTIKTKKTVVHVLITVVTFALVCAIAFINSILNSGAIKGNFANYLVSAIVFVVLSILLNFLWGLLTHKNEESKIAKHLYKKDVKRISDIEIEVKKIDNDIAELDRQVFDVKDQL